MNLWRAGCLSFVLGAAVIACGGPEAKSPEASAAAPSSDPARPAATAPGGASGSAAVAPADPGSPPSTTGATAPAPVTGEWSLIDRETWTAYQADAAQWAEDVSKKCGAKITGSWNADSFRGHMADLTKDRWSRNRCSAAFEAVANICGQGDMQKQALNKKVKSIECAWGPEGKGNAAIQGSKLLVTIDTGKDAWTPDYMDIIRKSL